MTAADLPAQVERPQNEEEWHVKFLAASIRDIAARLHGLADEVARHGVAVWKLSDGSSRGTYVAIAEDVVHDITWGVANLRIERTIRDAAAADVARAVAKTVLP